jgi:hypothetical protein
MDRHQADAAEQAARCSACKMTIACSMASSGSCVQVLRGATPLVAFHRGGAENDSLLSFPKARGQGPSFADGATSSRIVLVLVKKPGNQLLQLELTGRVIHRCSVLKELPLDFSRKIIPLHDHRRAKAPQHALFNCMECQS